jgi:hypothetical protein
MSPQQEVLINGGVNKELMTEREMITTFVLAIFTGAISVWCLYSRDKESRRLLEMDKYWRPLKHDEIESTRLQKIKKRMVIGYSVFLCVSIIGCAYFGLKIARFRGWF